MKVTVLVILTAVIVSCGEGNEVRVVEEQSTTPQEVTHTSSEVGPIDPKDEVEAPVSKSGNHSSETLPKKAASTDEQSLETGGDHSSETLGKKPTSEGVQASGTSGEVEATTTEDEPKEEYDHPLTGTYMVTDGRASIFDVDFNGDMTFDIVGSENGLLVVANGTLTLSMFADPIWVTHCQARVTEWVLGEGLEVEEEIGISGDCQIEYFDEREDEEEEDDSEEIVILQETDYGFKRTVITKGGTSEVQYTRK